MIVHKQEGAINIVHYAFLYRVLTCILPCVSLNNLPDVVGFTHKRLPKKSEHIMNIIFDLVIE